MQSGGLRSKGIVKKINNNSPLITIITVVYNCVDVIEQTIKSVVAQKYDCFEYIIIDGNSTDGTVDIIKKYENQIDYWLSEPDKGIYDAMNKGILLALGKWINFMNAGDEFSDAYVLSNIFNINKHNCDVVFGDSIEIHNGSERRIIADKILRTLDRGPFFRHNAAFFNADLHKKNLFKIDRKDLGYGLDFKLIYDLYNQGKKFERVPVFVVKYQKEGVSNNKKLNNLYTYRIIREYHPIKALFLYCIRVFKNLM